jgi:hypothetical protein
MTGDERARSSDLDEVRKLLFPELPPEEGWARIDAAMAGAEDDRRIEAIEELCAGDLDQELIDALRRLHDKDDEDDPDRPET